MNATSQFHLAATISTGGAAKDVSVPLMDTLTKSTPMVAYLMRSAIGGAEDAVPQHQRCKVSLHRAPR